MTGISASTMASIIGRRLRPPSSFTRLGAGPNQLRGVADGVGGGHVVAHPGQVADDDGGHVSAARTRATAAVWWAMSSIVTCRVSS